MNELPLIEKNGYLFIELSNQLWLIDTGSPVSFGNHKALSVLDKAFNIKQSYMNLSVTQISAALGTECMGILGADVLNEFDYIFDIPNKILQISSFELTPSIHQFSDFYPGFGAFQTETYAVEFSLDRSSYTFRCGTLPNLLATTLMLADTQGIIGNEILLNKSVGYFPRRGILCL